MVGDTQKFDKRGHLYLLIRKAIESVVDCVVTDGLACAFHSFFTY